MAAIRLDWLDLARELDWAAPSGVDAPQLLPEVVSEDATVSEPTLEPLAGIDLWFYIA